MGRRRASIGEDDRRAMGIIARAAALLKSREGNQTCETPGCRYQIRYADGMIGIVVRFPADLNPGEALAKAPFYGEHWDDLLHDMTAVAVAQIIGNIRNVKEMPDAR